MFLNHRNVVQKQRFAETKKTSPGEHMGLHFESFWEALGSFGVTLGGPGIFFSFAELTFAVQQKNIQKNENKLPAGSKMRGRRHEDYYCGARVKRHILRKA